MMSDRSILCGCKGVRTCLKCERICGLPTKNFFRQVNEKPYVYCLECNKWWPGWTMNDSLEHPTHSGESISVSGLYIKLDFLSQEEEVNLATSLDKLPWDPSQSGRRKQNFGPKCNFKKRRLRVGAFSGFPAATRFVQEKFSNEDILKDYITIEQCSLEYDPDRGASIDPHIDDCWVWGERIVTVNLLADSVLSFRPYKGDRTKYNLNLVPQAHQNKYENIVLRAPMPRRSLFVMYGDLRYNWEHFILREDIKERRVCLAYREFTRPYLPGGELEEESRPIIEKCKIFSDTLASHQIQHVVN